MEVADMIGKWEDTSCYEINTIDIPDFLRPVFRCSSRVIFVSKKATETSFIDASKSKVQETSTVLELTGSPLKCSFEGDDDLPTTFNFKEELRYIPVSLQESRNILSSYQLNMKDDPSLPMWVFCDGKNSSQTILQTAHRHGDWNSSSSLRLCGSCSRAQIDKHVDTLKSQHCKTGYKMETQVTGVYSVYDELLESSSGGSDRVSLEMTWSNLSCNPPPDSKCTLVMQVNVGNTGSEVFQLWEQVLLVQDCIFKAYEPNYFSKPVLHFIMSSKPSEPIQNRVMDLLKSAEYSMRRRRAAFCPNPESEGISLHEAVRETLDSQCSNDFTDKLWLLLKECKEDEEIPNIVNMVFKEIKSGHSKPFLHHDNGTRMAQLLKNLIGNRTMELPNLQPQKCFEMVAEIGLRKLMNDYVHILVSSKLATIHQLKKNVVLEKSENTCKDYSTILRYLGHLHEVLEVTIFASNKVSGSHYLLQQVFTEMFSAHPDSTSLRPLESHAVNITLPVSSGDFEDLMYRCFSTYHITASSKSDWHATESVMYCSVSPLHLGQTEADDSLFSATGSPPLNEEEIFHCYVLTTNKIRLK